MLRLCRVVTAILVLGLSAALGQIVNTQYSDTGAAKSVTPATVQNATNRPPRWTVLVDPVCPVSPLYGDSLPNATKQLRILYFPESKNAKLKNPESLILNVGLNMPRSLPPEAIPLVRKDDHWEATIDLLQHRASYAIFSFRDDKTRVVDDNGGRYWDVVFCNPEGQKDMNGVMSQAEGYTGAGWGTNIRRAKDYDKAISVLEQAVATNDSVRRSGMALPNLWGYKAQREGGNREAFAKLVSEIERYVAEHPDAKISLGNFIAQYHDRLPPDFVERTIAALDADKRDPSDSLRARVLFNRANRESDPKKRLAALDELLTKYPDAVMSVFAEQMRFFAFLQLEDVAGAETALARYREAAARQKNRVMADANNESQLLAKLYIDKGVKLEEALKLLDETSASVKAAAAKYKWPEQMEKSGQASIELQRARAYLALKKPDLALVSAQKTFETYKNAQTYFVLAQAYEATGDKQKALDAYFNAALKPSNEDLTYTERLQQFYLKNHFGNRQQFTAELEKRRAADFQNARYTPKLVDRPAPELEFVTLKGEKFDPASLRGKTVVVNFWSPG